MQISGLSLKVMKDLALAFSSFTPENIKACGDAEAAALKLTEPEKAKRDECVSIINSVAPKLKELEDAKIEHAATLKAIEAAQTGFNEREKAIQDGEKKNSDIAQKLVDRETAIKNKEKELDDYSDRLDGIATGHKIKTEELEKLENSLNDQAESFEKAQQIIKKK